MYHLSDIAEFARTKGARDKKRRKRRLMYLGAGALGLGALVAGGYALTRGKKVVKPLSNTQKSNLKEEEFKEGLQAYEKRQSLLRQAGKSDKKISDMSDKELEAYLKKLNSEYGKDPMAFRSGKPLYSKDLTQKDWNDLMNDKDVVWNVG
jgi:hypothetical protein